MKIIISIFLFIFILTNCSFLKIENSLHSLTQEPFRITEKQKTKAHKDLSWLVKAHSTQAVQWWISYKKALLLKNTNAGCGYMRFLSKIKNFPLRHHARLNFYSQCHSQLDIDLSSYPVFLRKTAVEQKHKKAERLQQKQAVMLSAYQLYKQHSNKEEKEKYLLKAIHLAGKLKAPQQKKWKKELHIIAPRFILKPSLSQKLAAAKDLKRTYNWKKAKIYYRQILNNSRSSFIDKNKSFKDIRQIYKLEKNNKKYLIATLQWRYFLKRNIKKHKKARQSYHDISFLLAQTQWTLNKPYQALKTLERAEKELKNKISFFKIYRLKAQIFAELNQQDKTILFLRKSLKEKPFHPAAEEIDKTKWQLAWILKKTGNITACLSVLQDLLETTKSDYLPSKILFWKGQIYANNNQLKTAENIYKSLIQKDPLSYYGLLAHYKTKTLIQLGKQKNINKILNKNTNYITAYWLLSLGETQPALNFLNYKLKQLKQEQPFTEEKEMLFHYMAKGKFYLPLFRMAGALPLKDRTLLFKFYTSLLFPMDYEKEIKKASQIFNIEKELIYALIRQESAYNPKARSPAEALGLMQILPFVARATAKKEGIIYKNRQDLYHPEKNILLGSAFLKNLFQKYNSQFITALAVYNAGGTAVHKWLKRSKIDNPLAFIEEIPYEETRTYVKLLIRNFIFYKLLNSKKHSIEFPEWLIFIKKPNN